jgi:hypothetical protein
MTSIRKLASALFLALCFSAYSNAQQIDNSDNLINNNNWSGAVYGADPGGCCASISGSGPLYDTTTDTIMFSYGQSTVSQTIGINQALGGTGIQVHGYNFSWDFRYISNNTTRNDTLNFNVALRDSSGTVVESQNYSWDNATILYDAWYTASNTHTYANPYTDPQSITLSITGRDGGFWAGYYGPEVRNVSLSVNYSFDPCAADPLYSSSCPGYLEAYMANLFSLLGWGSSPEPEIEVASVDYSLTPSTTSSTSIPEETTTGEVKVDAGGIEVTSTGELQVPDGIPEEVREKKPVDMNLISRIVREATDESATMAIVNQSIEQSMEENANPDFSMTNETLASISRQTENSIQQSLTENQDLNAISVETSQSESTPVQEFVQFESPQIVIEQQNESSQQSIVEIPQSTVSIIFDAQNVSTEVTNLPQNITQGQNETSELQTETKVETSELQNQSLPRMMNEDQKETTQTVKKEVQNNEAAGNVGIDSIAKEPLNFDAYLNKQLADIQFYKTEEIYKNLEPVDNRRSLRLLSGANDRLHQEMINEQYRRR